MWLFRSSKKTEEKTKDEVVDESPSDTEGSAEPALKVEDIHNAFMEEVDNIVEETKNIEELDEGFEEAEKRHEKLHKLGFRRSNTARQYEAKVNNNKEKKERNEERTITKEAVDYFSTKYPGYKFIIETSIQHLCSKYGLVHADSIDYEGDIPEKNIQQMERFKIDEEDVCWGFKVASNGRRSLREAYSKKELLDRPNTIQCNYIYRRDLDYYEPTSGNVVLEFRDAAEYNSFVKDESGGIVYTLNNASVRVFNPYKFEIAAPSNLLNLRGKEIDENNKLVDKTPPDPIVFQPVVYKNRKYHLIVTAWGEEASDEDVVNQKMN